MVNSSEEQLNRSGNRRGMSQKSHRNLGVYLKGNGHAKKDYSITRILKEMADDQAPERWLEVEDKGKGLTYRQAAARRIWIDVIRGNAKLTGELLDRLDGKVTQPIGGDTEHPLEVTATFRFIMPDGSAKTASELLRESSK